MSEMRSVMRNFTGSSEDVHHWVRHLEMEAASAHFDDQQLLYKACSNLTGAAASWLDTIVLSTWSDFKVSLINRFGEQPEVIVNKLYSCRQDRSEDVASFADRFQQLTAKLTLSQNSMPNCLILRLFIDGLQSDIRTQVIVKHPLTIEQAIQDARYLEEFQSAYQAPLSTPPVHNRPSRNNPPNYSPAVSNDRGSQDRHRQQNNHRQQPQHHPQQHQQAGQNTRPTAWPPRGAGKVEELQRQLERMTLQLAQLGGAPLQANAGQMIHLDNDYPDCTEDAAYPEEYNNHWHSQDQNAWAYAEDVEMPDASPLQSRRPRQRMGFDPNNLPRRGAPAPGAQPQGRPSPSGPANHAPNQPRSFPRPTPPQARPAPTQPAPARMPIIPAPVPAPRRTTRTAGAFHIADQLNSTAAKLTIGELLKVAPTVRAEAKALLEKLDAEDVAGRANANYTALECCMPTRTTPAHSQPAAYRHERYDSHLADSVPGISVVKAAVKVCNSEVSAIIDSGASHTMMSDILARKLHLYKHIHPTKAKFFTSSGKLEKPVGRLTDVPVTVGSLTLPVDVYVSPAHTYSLLLGNNFLAAAEAQINFGSKELVYRRDVETFEAVPLDYIELGQDSLKAAVTCLYQPEAEPVPQPEMYAQVVQEAPEPDNQAVQEAVPETPEPAVQDKETAGQPEAQDADQESDSQHDPYDADSDTDDQDSEDSKADLESDSQPDDEDINSGEPPAEEEHYWRVAQERALSSTSSHHTVSTLESDPHHWISDALFPDDASSGGDMTTLCELNMQNLCAHTEAEEKKYQASWKDVEVPPTIDQGCLDFMIKSAYGHEVVHTLSDPNSSPTRDTDDWQFDPHLFDRYYRAIPFDVDACADNNGDNAQMRRFWCPRDSCLQHSWAGLAVYCNPPWRLIDQILSHYLAQQELDMDGTLAVFVLPVWPWAPWYPTVMQHFDIMDYFPAGSQLFTAPSPDPATPSQRVYMGPTRWPVMVVVSAYNKALGRNFGSKYTPKDLPWGQGAEPKDLGRVQTGTQLTPEQHGNVQTLLVENNDIFAWNDHMNGKTHVVAHEIDTGDALPLKQRPYRLSPEEDSIVAREVNDWLEQGIVVPSTSPWASPVVLVQKKPLDPKDRQEKPKYRLCIDFRKINSLTKTDSFPLPIIQDALDGLGASQYFSIIDLRSAFLQLPLHPKDREKTAFVTKQGLFEFTVLPFGLKNSPAVFQRLMHQVLRGLQGNICTVFLDDIIVYSTTWESHLHRLREVMDRLRHYNLRAHPDKCKLGTHELLYLGHIINAEGNQVDPNKVAAITKIQPPENTTEVRAFLGLVGYYRRFIPDFAAIASPLHQLLKKSHTGGWDEACEQSFQDLKQRLLQPPILSRPVAVGMFTLQTDWSQKAIAAVLCQEQEGKEQTIAYASKSLNPAECNYSATEGECLAIIWACKYFRHYLWGRTFRLQTDHQALRWLMTTTDLTGKLARWSLKLQEYSFEIVYRPGSANANADALTRLPICNGDDDVIIHLCTSSFHHDPDYQPAHKRAKAAADPQSSAAEAAGSFVQPPARPDFGSNQLTVATPPQRERQQQPSSSATILSKDVIVDRLLNDQLSGMGPGCYHLRSGEELWQEYLEEHHIPQPQEELERVDKGKGPLLETTPAPAVPEELSEDEDRSDSVSLSLPCEVCTATDDETRMLVCDSCNKGYHTHCLTPTVYDIPEDSWYCGDCGGLSQTSSDFIDVTEDKHVLQYLASGVSQDWSALERKRVGKRAKNYSIHPTSRQLFRKPTSSHGKTYPARPVLSKLQRRAAISACHSLGHYGILRTAALVSERYYWGGIVQDCKAYINNCHECKLEHAHFAQPQKMQSIPVSDQSFQQVGIDLVGPLQPSASGNRYIIVVMDYLTKWCEVLAVPTKTAATVADFFLENVIARHGCPKTVISDNGGEFQAEFAALLQSFNIDHRHSSPNHPATNGLVEHFNGTLVTALRKCVATDSTRWDKAIPLVLLGYRSTLQASTRYSPFYMLYARQPVLPMEARQDTIDVSNLSDDRASSMILDRAATIQETAQRALGNIAKAQAKQKRDYKTKRKHVEPTTLQEGDWVVIKASSRRSKLEPPAQPTILRLERFANEEKTMAIVCDASRPPRRWKENISNIAKYEAA